MEKVEKILNLINKRRVLTLSQEEENELQIWLAESDENRSLFTELSDEKILAEKLKAYARVDSEAIWKKTIQQIEPATKVKTLYPVGGLWWKYAAAAAVVVGVALAGWWYAKPTAPQATAGHQTSPASTNEIVPGSAKAILTLFDGQKMVLDNSTDQQKIEQQGITISKANGQLQYHSVNEANGKGPIAVGPSVLYNTVSTPEGGQFQVILPDGSIVWLNAASSLRFPIAFAGGERNVSLTGEAFFEVAPMADKPFKVAISSPLGDGGTVEVLGTRFNINAYTDDALVRTTLLHGSVRLTTKTAAQKVLKPGQEALVDKGGNVQKVLEVDAATAVPWMNDEINLETGLKVAMQEIGRWYNLKIEYAGKIPEKSLKGQISRQYAIEDVIKVLRSQGIKLELNSTDKKIVIT
jgi:ferric-dicitrate binding protein FerR (iron transport regulator)